VLSHAEAKPDGVCFRLVSSRAGRPVQDAQRTWGDVATGAASAAGFLKERGVRRGDVVVLMGTHHADLYAGWLGCVWLGAVPSVLAEPSVRIDRGVYWSRLKELLARIDARALLADPAVGVDTTWPAACPRFTYEEAAAPGPAPVDPVDPEPGDLLLLQHSSGTTGLHKGVMLSHGAVTCHHEAYARALSLRGDEVLATWLPLYHDMGLIACFVTPLVAGIPVVWLSPFEWVANPALLLHAVGEWRATHVWLPNFAFSFLAQRVRDPRGSLRLSSLRAVVNCSEPVSAEAMDAFAARFADDGLDSAALHACYAMAETVFAVSTSTTATPPRRRRVDRRAWHDEHIARPAPDGPAGEASVVHVSNGVPVSGCEVRVGPVDGGSASLGPAAAGRVWVRSPFLFDGYFRRDDLNAALFDADGFYDTGDLGYVDEAGHVYVTGRLKDLVIVGGRNVYPHDVEAAVGEVPGVHPGRVVVFGVPHRGLATEGLVALVESDLPESGWPEVARGVRTCVPGRLDLDLLDVRVVTKGALRKSTSGKLARAGNREWYLAGRFGPLPAVVSPPEGE
jgi:acyl-CoA synthetase (AMP-forming)/AMP-acid ligase II